MTGNVYSARDLDPPENTLVLLYKQLTDSSVVKQLPDYITRASNNGEFRIDNVHPGIYRLYALVDADNSKNYNNRDEMFAFYEEPVQITPEKNYLPVKKDSAAVVIQKPVDGKTPFKPPVVGEYPMIMFQAEKEIALPYILSKKAVLPVNLYTVASARHFQI